MHRTWSQRHPWVASLVGAAIGFVAGVFIFRSLVFLSPLVVVDARGEGKGGHAVEALWYWFGIPLSTIVGALWPHTVGRIFNRPRTPEPDRQQSP